MKKIITLTLVFCMVLSTSINVNAQSNENDLPENITIVNKNDVLTSEMKQDLAKEEQELAKEGLHKTSEVYYIENKDLQILSLDSVMSLKTSTNHIAKVVQSVRTYTSETEELSKSKYGMAHWLDVAWNLAIGSKTKYVWKAATILGINPSNFLSKYHRGEALKRTYQRTYRDILYYGKNSRNEVHPCIRVSKLILTTYVDLYTSTKTGSAYRKSSSSKKSYYTEHYGDMSFISEQCLDNSTFGGMSVYQDNFK